MTARKDGQPKRPPQRKPKPIEGLDWACRAKTSRIDWLLRGAVPANSLVLLEGRKAVGKSCVCAAIAAGITGGPVLPHWGGMAAGAVIWAGSEDPWEAVIVPRLRAAGAKLALVARLGSIMTPDGSRRLLLPEDLSILRERMVAAKAKLLVLDPYVSLAHPTLDVRVEQQARAYLEPLGTMLAEIGAVGLLSRHLRKGTMGDARDAGLGAGAVGNVARAVLRCDEHPLQPGKFVLSVVAGNWAQRMPTQVYEILDGEGGYPRLRWAGDSDLQADEIAEGRGTASQRDEATDADTLILHLLRKGAVAYSTIWKEAQDAGITQSALRATKVRLRIRSKRVSTEGGGHWEWEAPKEGFPKNRPEEGGEGGGACVRPHLDQDVGRQPPKTPGKTGKMSRRGGARTRPPLKGQDEGANGHADKTPTA